MKALKKLWLWLGFAFLYAPIIVLMVYSFNESRSRANWTGFTLRWYQEVFADEAIMHALLVTLSIALLAALISTLIGAMAALAISDMGRWRKTAVLQITYLPVLNPDIVTAISLMMLFILSGVTMGYGSILLAHISFCTPFVILCVLPKLGQMDSHLYEAALDLGAGSFLAFRKVVIPEIMPGIFTGFLFAVTLSLDDFVVSFFTSGSGINTLSMTIYSMARRGINPKINAICTILFVLVMLGLLLVVWRSRSKARKAQLPESVRF